MNITKFFLMRASRLILALIIAVVLFVGVIIFFIGTFFKDSSIATNAVCPARVEQHEVLGNSMSPRILAGTFVDIAFGDFDCLEIARGDVAAISFQWRDRDIIKIIMGMPGDALALEETEGGYHILINHEILVNFEDEPYFLTYARSRMLDLYIRDYDGIIPEDAYLVFGNLPQGTEDSTQFGLIAGENIIGKVVEK